MDEVSIENEHPTLLSPCIEPSIPGTTDPPNTKPAFYSKLKLPPIPRFHSTSGLDPPKNSPTSPTQPVSLLKKKPFTDQDVPPRKHSKSSIIQPGRSMRASTGMLHVPILMRHAGKGKGKDDDEDDDEDDEEEDDDDDDERDDLGSPPRGSFESMLHRFYHRMKTMVDHKTQLRVFIGTWNMHGTLPHDLEGFVPNPPFSKKPSVNWRDFSSMFRLDEGHHVLVFGTQECQKSIQESVLFPSKAEWEKKLKLIYQDHYDMVASETMAALHLCVFIRKKLRPLVSCFVSFFLGKDRGTGQRREQNRTEQNRTDM
ncbi:inositol polyphosphate 5-phosphatase [Coelomomyces lativittatus]|nr:inositol polyphosphate 5-phosphatase [Coelomomyces lativittatus]